MIWPFLIELIIFFALAWLAFRHGVFAASGIVACALIFILVSWGGNWVWGALVLLYLAGTELSVLYGSTIKASLLNRLLGRTLFDWRVVLGRLGWGLMVMLLAWRDPYNLVTISAFTGVIAVALGDTLATEIGTLNQNKPRRITTGQVVAAGTPGAITWLGIISAVGAGWLSGFTTLVCYFIIGLSHPMIEIRALYWLPAAATLGGLVGVLVDSLLGATAQGAYFCDRCQRYSEEAVHQCGLPARQTSGWHWLTNQGVDLVSSLVGCAVTVSVVLLASLSL